MNSKKHTKTLVTQIPARWYFFFLDANPCILHTINMESNKRCNTESLRGPVSLYFYFTFRETHTNRVFDREKFVDFCRSLLTYEPVERFEFRSPQDFTNTDACFLIDCLKHHKKHLKFILLYNVPLSTLAFNGILEILSNDTLGRLDLTNCNIGDEDVSRLVLQLFDLRSPTWIDLSENDIGAEGICTLALLIQKCRTINTMLLEGNPGLINDRAFKCLTDAIQTNVSTAVLVSDFKIFQAPDLYTCCAETESDVCINGLCHTLLRRCLYLYKRNRLVELYIYTNYIRELVQRYCLIFCQLNLSPYISLYIIQHIVIMQMRDEFRDEYHDEMISPGKNEYIDAMDRMGANHDFIRILQNGVSAYRRNKQKGLK